MSKAKKTRFEPFESKYERDIFARITKSMLESEAWEDLTAKQQILYLYCKMQKGLKDKKAFDIEYQNDSNCFTMNRYKFVEKYKLYSDGNRKAFHKDMDALIEHGFIDCVISGKQARMKSLYKYSDRWKKWGTPEYVITPNHRTTSGNKNAYKESNNMW